MGWIDYHFFSFITVVYYKYCAFKIIRNDITSKKGNLSLICAFNIRGEINEFFTVKIIQLFF